MTRMDIYGQNKTMKLPRKFYKSLLLVFVIQKWYDGDMGHPDILTGFDKLEPEGEKERADL